jgi:probable ribonuclease FAU-1
VRVCHAKPGGRTVTTRCTVGGWAEGVLVLLRTFLGGGRYDSIGAPILAGDNGTIEVVPGGWVLRRTYARAGGEPIGELYNIQTPVQLAGDEVRYLDLEVDVVRWPDGRVAIVDLDELEQVEHRGLISAQLAATARGVADALAEVLRQGGDWRTADQAYRASA